MKDIIAIVLFFGGLLFTLISIVILIFKTKELEDFPKNFYRLKYGIIAMTIGLIIGTF